jgi:hypothetical protein
MDRTKRLEKTTICKRDTLAIPSPLYQRSFATEVIPLPCSYTSSLDDYYQCLVSDGNGSQSLIQF